MTVALNTEATTLPGNQSPGGDGTPPPPGGSGYLRLPDCLNPILLLPLERETETQRELGVLPRVMPHTRAELGRDLASCLPFRALSLA